MRNLEGILACPDCMSPLTVRDMGIEPCPGCRRSFEIVDGAPILHPGRDRRTDEAGRRFFIEEPGRLETLRRDHPRLARLLELPDFSNGAAPLPRCAAWMNDHVSHGVSGERILNLGSGVHKLYGSPNLVNLDIAPHPNAQVVGNGEALPFRDGVFDGVVLDAVIEHLAHPHRVVAEVKRVLKPGGVALAHVPFLYPFHAAPHDYQRYTPAGLAMLFEDFEILEAGTDRRPGRAVLEIMTAYAAGFSDNRSVSYALRWLTAWCWLPIKFLDPWLAKRQRADYVTAGSSILARKPAATEPP